MGASICALPLRTLADNEGLRETIRDSKMLFVVSTGNDGLLLDDAMCYPACYDFENIITVGSVRSDGNPSCSSNYSQRFVDIFAPGSNIVSTASGGGYAYLNGTSISTVYAAGIAALVKSKFPELTAAEIAQKLKANAKPLVTLEGKCDSGGVIDAGSCLD